MKHSRSRGTKYVLSILLVLAVLAGAQSDRLDGTVTDADGLRTVTFDLPAGKVRVFLPDDIAAGDTISGTVAVEPKGNTPEERAKNQDSLEGMVLDVQEQDKDPLPAGFERGDIRHPYGLKRKDITINLRKTWSSASPHLAISVRSSDGKGPVQTALVKALTSNQPPPKDLMLPTIGQAGRPIRAIGKFDGNAATTHATIGQKPIDVLAESPRQSIFRSPTDIVGPTEIAVNEEGTHNVTGPFRNLSVKLSASKTNLKRGETAKVYLEIKGIEGESEQIPLHVVTTGTVNMQGGNVQYLPITGSSAGSDGIYRRDLTLTATAAGGFSVTATVKPIQPVAGNNTCKCECELAKTPIVSAGKRKGQFSFSPNVAKASCNGNQCSVAKIEYSWTVGAGSTATYTIKGGNTTGQTLTLDVTTAGTVELTVTVTVTCSDGSTCSSTGSKSFPVDAK